MALFVATLLCAVAAVALASGTAFAVEPEYKDVQIPVGESTVLHEFGDTGYDAEVSGNEEGFLSITVTEGYYDDESGIDYPAEVRAFAKRPGKTQVTFRQKYYADGEGEKERYIIFNVEVYQKTAKTVKPGRVLDLGTYEARPGDTWYKVSSSNTSVGKIARISDGNVDYTVKLVCLKPGKTTVTVTWGYFGDYNNPAEEEYMTLGKSVWNITVSNSGSYAVSKAECDALWTGKYYSIKGLFSDYAQFGAYPALRSKTGKFLSGSGYKVYKNGTLVKFTSGGKKTVKFRSGGKTYSLTLDAVHSKSATQAALAKKIKARYASYKHVSTALLDTKSMGRCVRDTYTIKKGGKRVTKKSYAWFNEGNFSWLF
ncbi:MAG: hypothetical protein Q4D06_09225 [Coriobacteriia bacterium]|nr:hypothetical protein [Coriobacteriia bacterium]